MKKAVKKTKPTTIKTKKTPIKKTSLLSPKKTSPWIIFLGVVNILAFVAVILINYLAVQLPIWWMTTGQLADLYPNLFTPAGLTFSIWGLIYLTVFGFVVWQLVDLFKKKSRWITRKVWIRFLLSCIANVGWIFAWHYQQVTLSLLIMVLFLVILIVLSYKVSLGKKLWSRWDKLFVQVPFSLYLWRISVATIANTAAVLVHLQRTMRSMSPVFWTILVIIVATLLALLALWKKYNVIFALVVIWAFIGIIIKTLWAEIVYTQIVWVLGACIAVIATGIWLRWEKWRIN